MERFADAVHWRDLTLPGQFLLAGAIVMVGAMIFVGNWISQRIEDAVVQNSATSAALFMESFISPLSQELAETDTLSPPARQALEEIFDGTALGERVVSYKIWLDGGRIVHASDPALIGQEFEPTDALKQAWNGELASTFEDLNDLEDEAEAELGVPLLEVYSPIRQVWTGKVIAVAEFYESAEHLAADIRSARQTSWLVVGGAFVASGLLLFWIVQAGGHTIRHQRQALTEQLAKTEKISAQNASLRQRVVAASSRATAQTERAIRTIGSDLHDGPAQYLSLASLRLDGALDGRRSASKDVVLVRESLDKALDELRIISRGLALPDLDSLEIGALIDRAVNDHHRQTGLVITVDISVRPDLPLNYAQKLCVFRFLQETLSNVSRHAKVDKVSVTASFHDQSLTITVADTGQGFDPAQSRHLRSDGGQGLFGLRDRAESIGGQFVINARPGAGSTLSLILPFEEMSQ
ncbi:sensor histidine kinase [Sulfitobacter sp. MF3-043]|uniref:sensor histidine kinase n=1 Tax=Sulfitobacter sediminivivens TaxID=3252902 RepID=UPI0036DC1534